MKLIITIFSLLLLFNFYFILAEEKGNVKLEFILYDELTDINTASIQQKLNDNVDRISNDLQVTNTGTIRVHIWGNNESFLAAQTRYAGRNWPGSTGFLMGPNDLGILNVGNIAEIAEHEFVHCITTHITPRIVTWIWEAVAVYEANEFTDPKSLSYLVEGNYPTIEELNEDPATGSRKIYRVGYLIIEYVIHNWGKEKVVELLRTGGDIQSSLNLSVSEFEQGWKNFVINKYFNSTFAAENPADIMQNSFTLNQNYPNPFNPETVISYTIGTSRLSVSSLVTLKVYDILGNEVATLVNEEQSPGNYEVKFNACSNGSIELCSGVYLYKLKAGQFVKTNKMILMR